MPAADPRRPGRRGFSLIEVLVAFVLLAFVLTAGIVLFTWQRQRLYEQNLWRRALEAVEEESETIRALPRGFLPLGEGQAFVTMPEPGVMPTSMRWLPNPVASLDAVAVADDPALAQVILSLSWSVGDRRVQHREAFLVLR